MKTSILFLTALLITGSAAYAQKEIGRESGVVHGGQVQIEGRAGGKSETYAPVVRNGNEWTLNGVNWTAEDKLTLISLLDKIGSGSYFIEECVNDKDRKTYGKANKPGDTHDSRPWPWADFLKPRYPWVHHGIVILPPSGNKETNAKIEAILNKYSKLPG